MDAGEWWDAGCSGAPTPGGEGVSVNRPAALQGPVPLNANDMPLRETGLTGWFLGAPRGTASRGRGPTPRGRGSWSISPRRPRGHPRDCRPRPGAPRARRDASSARQAGETAQSAGGNPLELTAARELLVEIGHALGPAVERAQRELLVGRVDL